MKYTLCALPHTYQNVGSRPEIALFPDRYLKLDWVSTVTNEEQETTPPFAF